MKKLTTYLGLAFFILGLVPHGQAQQFVNPAIPRMSADYFNPHPSQTSYNHASGDALDAIHDYVCVTITDYEDAQKADNLEAIAKTKEAIAKAKTEGVTEDKLPKLPKLYESSPEAESCRASLKPALLNVDSKTKGDQRKRMASALAYYVARQGNFQSSHNTYVRNLILNHIKSQYILAETIYPRNRNVVWKSLSEISDLIEGYMHADVVEQMRIEERGVVKDTVLEGAKDAAFIFSLLMGTGVVTNMYARSGVQMFNPARWPAEFGNFLKSAGSGVWKVGRLIFSTKSGRAAARASDALVMAEEAEAQYGASSADAFNELMDKAGRQALSERPVPSIVKTILRHTKGWRLYVTPISIAAVYDAALHYFRETVFVPGRLLAEAQQSVKLHEEERTKDDRDAMNELSAHLEQMNVEELQKGLKFLHDNYVRYLDDQGNKVLFGADSLDAQMAKYGPALDQPLQEDQDENIKRAFPLYLAMEKRLAQLLAPKQGPAAAGTPKAAAVAPVPVKPVAPVLPSAPKATPEPVKATPAQVKAATPAPKTPVSQAEAALVGPLPTTPAEAPVVTPAPPPAAPVGGVYHFAQSEDEDAPAPKATKASPAPKGKAK